MRIKTDKSQFEMKDDQEEIGKEDVLETTTVNIEDSHMAGESQVVTK